MKRTPPAASAPRPSPPRRRRSAIQWRDLVGAWQASGQTLEAFAGSQGLGVGTLRRWAGRFSLGRQGRTPTTATYSAGAALPRFLPMQILPEVRAPEPGVRWEILFEGDRRLRVYDGIDAAGLGAVIEAMARSRRSGKAPR